MVQSLRIIGAILSCIAGSSSALTSPLTSENAKISTSTWGVSSDVVTHEIRRAELTTMRRRDPFVMMPATLERPTVNPGAAGPAVLDRPVVEKRQNKEPVKERKRTGSEGWEVRIYNDGKNTREFVARCLVQITGLKEIEAYQTMMQAHQNGIAVVGRYNYERAEMYHDALKTKGIVCDLVPVEEER